MNPSKFFSKSGPFELRQLGWCDLWRSHAMYTGMTQGASSCLFIDMEPRRLKLHQPVWRDWVTPSAPERLIAQPPCATCPPVMPEQLAWLSHTALVGVIGGKFELARALLPSLPSLFSFSLFTSHSRTCDRHHLILRRCRSTWFGRRSWATPILVLPKGCSPLLTE
jgi:hypothetical protein